VETDTKAKKTVPLTPLRAIVELVRRGHREHLPRLRELLRQSPDVFRHVGNLGQQAQRAWADVIAGPDDVLRESLVLRAEERKELLAGRGASELETTAAARIVAAEMEVEYLDMWRAQHPEAEGTKLGELYKKRFEEAERRLDRAIKSLATVKKLLPRTIQVELLNPPVVPRSAVQSAGGQFNGVDPETGKMRVAQSTKAAKDGTAQPVNGVNRIGKRLNGHHDRHGEILEPTAIK
jgi:hypothetical protein